MLFVSRYGILSPWVEWADGWVWVLVEIGCKRVLNNFFKIDRIKGSTIRFLHHD